MKTLKNHVLIYDNECPMCAIYSKGFIHSGMLDENGREAFTEISLEHKNLVDCTRAKNEIALIDQNTHKVIYGLDSLLLIIGNSFPLLEKVARISPFYWFFKKLYSFVSYNRKQIIPSKNDTEQACIPNFNFKYRLAYISFVVIFSGYILSQLSVKMGLGLSQNFWRELSICIGQIGWQVFLLKSYLKDKTWNYVGNMMTVSLIGTLLLIPALYLNISPIFTIIYFGIVVLIMVLEHIRRCSILRLNFLPTITWISYRVLVLLMLIYYYV
ncbi:hypothetical protein D1631_08820 [Chryseobacterium nematophagum]|uniref:DUF393 domain-containing protein n=1 Tax=Chryseobacterium nematophagum TaxID=2305228 RepID=A0A3M7TET9_9FLAO|nr:hypothetical protein [Chryseobacterium nematophagum]RNA62031.1 hypothetical protein D1631_08820 [Chryseobacterium nematophagum]